MVWASAGEQRVAKRGGQHRRNPDPPEHHFGVQRGETISAFDTDFRYLRVTIGTVASPAEMSVLALSFQLPPSVKLNASVNRQL